MQAMQNHSWEYLGDGLKYVDINDLKGHLIVIEGLDACGRSTQVQMLSEYLENAGYPVLQAGIKRSELLSKTIDKAKEGNSLGKITMALFYTTDFADQLENSIIPALRAGFIVIADRYIYSIMARQQVRGLSTNWLKKVLGFALKPSLVFFLDVSPIYQIHRYFKKFGSMHYWEAGMDMGLSDDIVDSFKKYQKLLRDEFLQLSAEHDFKLINADETDEKIHSHIKKYLKEKLNI